MRKLLLALAFALIAPFSIAQAATCFWVAGTTWNNSANWSSATGPGGGGTCAATGGIPKNAGDIAKLDANSPAATTLTLDIDISIGQIDMTALTGSSGFDASTHNISVNLNPGFTGTGTGTRTLSMGSGTWTIADNSSWQIITTTNLTFNKGTANLLLTPVNNTVSLYTGGLTLNLVTVTATGAGIVGVNTGDAHDMTVDNLAISAGSSLSLQQGRTLQVNNAFTITGTASAPVVFQSGATGTAITFKAMSPSTCTWCIFRSVAGSTSTITANPGISLGNTSGTLSITPPSGGGGSSAANIFGGQ